MHVQVAVVNVIILLIEGEREARKELEGIEKRG